MSQPSTRNFRFYLPILVSVALLAGAFSQFGLSDVVVQLTELSAGHIALMIAASALNLLIVSGRLVRLLGHMGYSVPAVRVLIANIAGLASSLLIVSLVGSMVGRHLVLRGHGVSAAANAFIVTYERAILVVVGGILFCIGGIILFGQGTIWEIASQLPLIYFVAALAGAVALSMWLSRNHLEGAIRATVFSVSAALRFLELSAITVAAQALTFCVYVVAAAALSPQTPLIDLFAAAAVIAFASSFPLSVNGWGIREIAAIFALGTLGISSVDALTISVSVGLVSTLTVIAAGMTAAALGTKRAMGDRSADNAVPDDDRTATADRAMKAMALFLPLAAGILLFFQAGVTWNGGLISVNLADPVAIVGLALFLLIALSERRLFARFSPLTWVWIATATAVLSIVFMIGWARFGVTPWALNNRVIGWIVLLGYIALGGLLVQAWALYGLRRLGEVLVATAASVTVVSLGMLLVHHFFGIDTLTEGNFQGFSFNRNGFSFQLNIALCFALAYAPFRWRGAGWRHARVIVWSVLTGLILYGIWQAQSRTGILVAGGLIAVALIFRMTHFRAVAGAAVFAGALYLGITLLTTVLAAFLPGAEEIARLARPPEHFNPESVTERWRSLVDSLTIWLDNPFFGAGLGAYMHSNLADGNKPLVIHSVPGWLLAEFGLLGVGAILVIPLVGAVSLARRVFQRHEGANPTPALLALLMAAFAVFGLTHDIAYQRIFWLSLGAVAAGYAVYAGRASRRAPDRPLKVLHVITSLDRGGAETMLTNLTRIAKQDGRDHAVASLMSGSALANDVRQSGVPLTELGFTQSFPNPVGILRLIFLIRRYRPDIVQGWMYHGDLVALIALYLSRRRACTKLVWGIRCSDMDYSKYSRVLRTVVWFCKRLSSLPDMVIANSEEGRRFHAQLGYRPRRFEVVANGIDAHRFQPRSERRAPLRAEMGIPPDARVAICVARVDEMKDHPGLMQAAARVPNLWLVLVGKDTEKLPDQDRVVRYGISSDVPDVLNVADAVVLGSKFGEGFSNALTEGMAAGLYPIATDVGDSRSIVEGVGTVTAPSNIPAMADALRRFLEMDDSELAAAKAAARDRILERYSLPKALAAFDECYWRLFAGPEPGTPSDR